MCENSRCSILFHLLVPGGKWQTVTSRPVSSANPWSSTFQSRTRDPLLPPPSAQISNRFANSDLIRLNGASISAIRAALDSMFVKETQRLNKMMVVLTISISGGPFLGLLGTVVGVMITFAAIAESGDVNVNAIAPGFFATEANTAMVDDEATATWLRQRSSLGRWGHSDEIGGTAVFLASPAATYVTGHVLAVDGGYLSHF